MCPESHDLFLAHSSQRAGSSLALVLFEQKREKKLMVQSKKREEIPGQYTWDLTSIFPTDKDWECAFQRIEKQLPELEELAGTLARSGSALLKALQKRDEVYEKLERVCAYASLHKDEDMTNSVRLSMAERALQLSVRISMAISYLEPEILALPPETLTRFLNETAELALYTHQLENLSRKRPHTRSPEVEAVLAAAGEISRRPNAIFSMIANADLKLPTMLDERGEVVQLTRGNYSTFTRSTDRTVRRAAFEAMQATFFKQRHTIAATLSAQIQGDIFYARQRNYKTCRQCALDHYNIPVSVYDTVLTTVSEYIPLLNRYMKLRKQALGLNELYMYDLFTPIVPEAEEEFSYEQACTMISQALEPLGEDYVADMQHGFSQRWVDVFETTGKRSGAYSAGAYGTYPFILLNFQHTVASVYTLAHELGHSMHAYYSRANQSYQYSKYTFFSTEVASLVNEELLTEYLLKTTRDPVARIAVLNRSLEYSSGILFRQTLFAEFEHRIHQYAEEGKALTADTLSELYKALLTKYYGGEIIFDNLSSIEWARIPHFYYNFYVYQYVTGLCAACALVQQILQEGSLAVARYRAFLSAGSSDYSTNLLQKAGVDMTQSEPVRQAFQSFKAHLLLLESLLHS